MNTDTDTDTDTDTEAMFRVTNTLPRIHSLSKVYKKVTLKKIYSSMFSPLYHLPALPILPVNSIFITDLPINLKPGKSSTLQRASTVIENIKLET
jgi:hypothetical protein